MLQALSDRGLLRERNEDAAATLALPDGSLLLAVADGLGGHPGGEVASHAALDALIERLRAQPPADPTAALRDAFEEANRAVRARQHGANARMGATLVAALVRGSRAWTANVGDSRAYLVPLDGGAARRLTEDHSWVEEQIRAGLLEPDDPLAALNRHVITRAIGLEERAGTDVTGPIALPDPCLLLLSSDGLHGVLDDAEIGRVVTESGGDYASELIDAVLDRGAPDNVAVALYVHRGDVAVTA
ncbi:MAG: serine/threonine-protein phosphatase [Chloroflexi bacterium]|nr:serine/threonine-protein phosphatase [Chloroflexota bacterium]